MSNIAISIQVVDGNNQSVEGVLVTLSVLGRTYSATTVNGMVGFNLVDSNTSYGIVTCTANNYTSISQIISFSGTLSTFVFTINAIVDASYNLIIQDKDYYPIENAVISINGQVMGVSNSVGLVTVSANTSSFILSCVAYNYIPYHVSCSYNTVPTLIVLKLTSQPKTVSFITNPFANVAITGNSLSDNTTADYTGVATSNIILSSGTYTVVSTLTNYSTSTDTVTIIPGNLYYYLTPLINQVDNLSGTILPPNTSVSNYYE